MSPCKTTTNYCTPASCLNRVLLFSQLAANESRQPPIGIKRSACYARRAVAYRGKQFVRFLLNAEEHDATYSKGKR